MPTNQTNSPVDHTPPTPAEAAADDAYSALNPPQVDLPEDLLRTIWTDPWAEATED